MDYGQGIYALKGFVNHEIFFYLSPFARGLRRL